MISADLSCRTSNTTFLHKAPCFLSSLLLGEDCCNCDTPFALLLLLGDFFICDHRLNLRRLFVVLQHRRNQDASTALDVHPSGTAHQATIGQSSDAPSSRLRMTEIHLVSCATLRHFSVQYFLFGDLVSKGAPQFAQTFPTKGL